VKSAAFVLSLALFAGCTHVQVAAPYGRPVRLMDATKKASIRRQYHAWFVIWGAVRLAGKDPVDVIRDEALCEARVQIEDNVPDAGIGFVYNFIQPIGLVPQTIVVEGNRNACE
jgi:hypothetical protein